MKNFLSFVRYCLLSLLLFTTLLLSQISAQERFQTPDGTSISRKIVFTENNVQYRIVATSYFVYAAKYSSNAWEKGAQICAMPPGNTIYDITIHSGASANLRTIYILLNDASIRYFTFNTTTLSIEGGISYIAPPQGAYVSSNTCKILCSDVLYLSTGNYNTFYVNHLDGGPWKNDTTGMNQPYIYIYGISFDKNNNILAGTGNGIYKLKAGDTLWTKYTTDTNINKLSLSSIFLHRDGKIYIATSNQIYYTTNDGTSWNLDTAGLGASPSVGRFGDDISGTTYAFRYQSTSLYRKKAAATSWEKIDTNLKNVIGTANGLIMDAGGDNSVEIATYYGMFSSNDKGSTWVNSSKGILSEDIYGLLFLPGNKLVASTYWGVYTKASPTDDWVKAYPKNGYLSGLNIFKDGVGDVYIQDTNNWHPHQANILKSTDAGMTWSSDNLGISDLPYNSSLNTFFVDKSSKEYYGITGTTSVPSMVYSKSNTDPWTADTAGSNLMATLGNRNNYFLNFGSDNITNIYFSTLSQTSTGASYPPTTLSTSYLYKRPLIGGNWSLDTNGLNNATIISMQVDPTGKMIAGSYSNGKLSSLYHKMGSTWQALSLPPASVKDAKYLTATDAALFVHFGSYSLSGNPSTAVTANRGIFMTTDYGNTWKYAGLDSVFVRGLVANGSDAYAFTNRGAYKLETSDLKIPKMVLSNKNLDFDTVSQYNHKDITVNFSNADGTDTLRVSSISSSNSAFKAQTVQFNVAPGFNKDVVLTFTPSVTGVVTGVITIASNYFPDSILVKGEGVNFGTPDITLDMHSIDFGSVDHYLTRDTMINVKASGTDTLRISTFSSSNSSFTIPVTTGKIGPGKSSDFKITFSPTIAGTNTGRILVLSNAKTDTILVTGIGTNFKVPTQILSTYQIIFDSTNVGTYRDSSFTISNDGGDTLRVTYIANISPFIAQPSSFNVAPGGHQDVSIRYTPQSGGPLPLEPMRITSNAKTDSIFLSGYGISKLTPCLKTHFIDFGNVKSGGAHKDTTLGITNIQADTLKITSLSYGGNMEYFTLDKQYTIAPNASENIKIKFTPIADGPDNATLVISSNFSSEYILLTGTGYSDGGKMVLSSKAINFNEVNVGTEKDATFKIYNKGNDYLYLSDVITSDSAFIPSHPPTFVNIGDSLIIHVKFSPKDSVQYTGKLIITSDYVPWDTINVQGKGKGVPTFVEEKTSNSLIFDIMPNPFSSATNMHVVLPEDGLMIIKLYDALGKEITTITNDFYSQGEYNLHFDSASNQFNQLESGMYYCRLITNSYSSTKAVVIIR